MEDVMESRNMSFFNVTMLDDPGIVCNDPATQNETACNKRALGISLSTPILMLSTGVLGNILALVVLYTSKKEVRKRVFFTLLAGLAWTDVIGQLSTGPIAIISYANNLQWQGGKPACIYHGYMMVCFGIITPLLVLLMSVDRVLALRFSYFYARVINVRKARILIVMIWIFTLFFCTLPLMGLGSYALQFPKSWCFLNFHRESTTDSVFAYMFSCINIVAIFLIFVCNSVVVVTLLQMRHSRRINNSPSLDRRFRVGERKPRNILQVEMETEMVWFLGAITVVFCTCYLPLNVNILMNQITGERDNTKDLMGVRLASINQILDPWLYILLRKAMFFKLLRRIKRFFANRKRPSSSRRHLTPYTDPSQHSSMGGHPLQTASRGPDGKNQLECVDSAIFKESGNKQTGSALVRKPDQRDTTHNCSDSESELFVEHHGRTKDSFISVDEYIMSQRRLSNGGDINGNKHLHRLYSLPAYLKENGKEGAE